MDIVIQREKFINAGYECIPLKPLSKNPLRKAWESKPTFTQWRNAPNDSNLGLRAGNGKAFIDCDDKNEHGTTENIINWLESLGHKREILPIVQTASGVSRHIYVQFTDAMLGSRRKFRPSFGDGDFRYGAASQVATFPSYVEGMGEYKLLQGDINRLPVLDIKDIALLININEQITDNKLTDQKKNKRPSQLALCIMQGIRPAKYSSDSEAEAGLVLSLINSKFTYEDIKHIFDSNPCMGHYTNKHKAKSAREAERWLYMTYKNQSDYSKLHESKTRRTIADWIEQAKMQAWKRVSDKNLYLAHLNFGHKVGSFEYAASFRDLSLETGSVLDTVRQGNKRLFDSGYLSVVKIGKGMSASIYNLECAKNVHFQRTLVGKCTKMAHLEQDKKQDIALHDAFMNGKGRLGRRAGEVYELLLHDPLTFEAIQKHTGIKTRTLRRVLSKLRMVKDRKTGEVIEMVTLSGDNVYYSNLVDLDLISAIFGTYGATGKRRDNYERERRDHARTLELGSLKA
jgi:hypothetical protein